MKKSILAFCFLFGAAFAVNAQVTQDPTPATDQSGTEYRSPAMSEEADDQDKDKQSIAVSELPSAVRDQLQGQDYSGWTAQNAYRKDKDGQTMYAVELSNGSETKVVKFDAQGNKLKEKEKDKKDK